MVRLRQTCELFFHDLLLCFLVLVAAHGPQMMQCQAAYASGFADELGNPLRAASNSMRVDVSKEFSTGHDTGAWSLLQIGRRPLSSGWFGAFSQDESTFDAEGTYASQEDPFWDVKYGRDPTGISPWHHKPALSHVFFHESRSGGASAAWQTHYPSASGSIAGNRHESENPWRHTPAGWVQDYIPRDESGAPGLWSTPADADWFDNAVNQIDGYGRQKTPSAFSGPCDADGWLERSVNTTITCKEPGCRARASLQLFDQSTEDARLCKVSIAVHPTDYEDDWSREHIEYWKFNDFIVSRNCNPQARGCNATAEKPLYHCVRDFDVDKIIGTLGILNLEGKNSQMVDECPHNDNLLSAVAMGTCMVRKKSTTTTTTALLVAEIHSEAVLKCIDPGCTAETILHFSPMIALNGGTCLLSMNVTQTDYDDKLGVPEELEFFTVAGKAIATKPIQPGRNPCNEEYKGKNISVEDRIFKAVEEIDVTKLVRESYPSGSLRIASKISPQVDECGYEGHLFFARVRVDCKTPEKFSAPPPFPLAVLDNAAVQDEVASIA